MNNIDVSQYPLSMRKSAALRKIKARFTGSGDHAGQFLSPEHGLLFGIINISVGDIGTNYERGAVEFLTCTPWIARILYTLEVIKEDGK